MSADDQTFLDTLSSVPNSITKHSLDMANFVDEQVNQISSILREQVAHIRQYLPESARPYAPPPPPQNLTSPALSMYEKVHGWAMKNRFLATVLVVAAGGVSYYVIKKSTGPRKKRRAKRAGTGARLEVVVIAGSPSEPMTRSIALDLERRGFIVYIVCNTIEEEVLVQNESRPDIKPLMIDIVDTESAKASIDRFTNYLRKPHAPIPGTKPHHLTLTSLLVIPPTTYPSQPIATISPSTLSDLLNTRLLSPILTTQLFLPLLQSLPLPHPPPSHQQPKPSILLLTPSIITSLTPSFHLPESLTTTALTTFATTLTSELSPLSIPITHLQLGTFDLPNPKHTLPRAQVLTWDDSARAAYAKSFNSMQGLGKGKGSSMRELNDAVFDAMAARRGGVLRVGSGSKVYGFIGRWVPRGLVGWMMRGKGGAVVESGGGIVRRERERIEEGGVDDSYISVYGEEGQCGSGDKAVDEVLGL